MEEQLTSTVVSDVFSATPYLLRLPARRLWIDYDQEADVLYISFERPQRATDSKMSDEGILFRYKGSRLVGLTVLEASKR